MTEQELKSRKGELVKAIRSLADKSNDKDHKWCDSDEKAWKSVDAELSDVQSKMDNREFDSGPETRLYGREDRMGNQGGADPIFRAKTHSGESFVDTATGRTVPVVRGSEKFVDAIAASRSQEWQKAREGRYDGLSFGGMLRALATGASSDAESRALAEGSDSAGGYMVPHYLSAQLIDLMRPKTRVFQAGAGTVELTSDRNSFAKVNSDPVPGFRSENSSVSESDPNFVSVNMQPKSGAVLIRVSRELLEDGVNTSASVQNMLAQAFASLVDRVCLVGTGASNEPTGLANMSNGINEVSKGANGAAVSNFTDILDAIKLLQDDNAGEVTAAIMNPRTYRVYSGLLDTTLNPMRRPFSIENLPLLETSQVPIDQVQGSATDASSIYLGNFSELIVGIRSSLRVEVLSERYADNLQVGFLAHMRFDVAAWHEQSLCRIVGIIP